MWTIHAAIHQWRQAVLLLFASVCCVWLLFSSAPFFPLFAPASSCSAFDSLASKASVLRCGWSWTTKCRLLKIMLRCGCSERKYPHWTLRRYFSSFFFFSLFSNPHLCFVLPCCHLRFTALLIAHIPCLYPPPCILVSFHLPLSVVLSPQWSDFRGVKHT